MLGDNPVLKDISFQVKKGETLAVLGASGSGKTTVLRVILGLYKPDSGKVFVAGEELTGLEDAIDMMPAELSGGMKKRAAIARGIVAEPKIMLYDEPSAGLDPQNAYKIRE